MRVEAVMCAELAAAADRWRALDDAELVSAMRASHPGAWNEFHERFHPLLELYARRVGISSWLIPDYVVTALDNAALTLGESTAVPPRNLGGYLCTVLRNHARMVRRGELRRERHQGDAATVLYGEHVVRSVCSEHAIRASAGPLLALVDDAGDRTVAQQARIALATALRAYLSDDDRRLIAWVEDAVPCREVASWLGISYEAAAKRITRLRQRLRVQAAACIAQLDAPLRRELAHLLPSLADCGHWNAADRQSPGSSL